MNPKAVKSWLMYDWANSVFATTMIAAVLPIFYKDVAAATLNNPDLAASYWGFTQSIAMLMVAILAPVLGAIADYSGSKLRMLRVFAYTGIIATAMFVFVDRGDYILASVLFIFGTIGFSGGNTFYDSLLPDLVPDDMRDYVSSKGYSYGYIAGGLLLAINLIMIQNPEWLFLPNGAVGMKVAFLSVAVWWFLFSLPIFKNIKETRKNVGLPISQYTAMGFKRIWGTFKNISKYPQLVKYLIAYWFYSDGINTIILMASIYGSLIGIGTSHLIMALLITQFVGFPSTLLLGKLAQRLGAKKVLYFTLTFYLLIVIFGYFMSTALHFYILAIAVGCVQGGSQAISRSIFSRLVPRNRSAEFFGFLNVSSKFSAVMGPFIFGMVGLLFGSARLGILALILFFIVGIALLVRVDIEQGRKEAEA
jgi:UMF1 family MFS transporter